MLDNVRWAGSHVGFYADRRWNSTDWDYEVEIEKLREVDDA